MKNYIQQLIELFGHNSYSSNTQKKVQGWLSDEKYADEKNEALSTLWQQAKEQQVPHDMQQSIQRMQRNLGMGSVAYLDKRYRLLFWKVAATVLLAVSTVSVYLLVGADRQQKDLIECHIPTAEIRQLTLPDGTVVVLNSKSTLLYPDEFTGKTRSVYLIGEANFQVKPDKDHPFIVKANDFQVTALGTEFNVNAYPENDELIATLLEGSVKVEFDGLTSNVILEPNEQVGYNKHTRQHRLQLSDVGDVTAWQRGELAFSNMCLEDIFTSLERKFPYAFVYSLHSLKDKTYSFRFHKQASIYEIMKIVEQVVGDVNYVIKGNKCYVTNME